MFKRVIIFLLVLLVPGAVIADNNVTVVKSTDGYVFVDISLKDISRIQCPEEIKSTAYSKEKAIEIKTAGRSAFVKLLPKKDPVKQTLIYEDIPRELFVECGGEVYSLVLVPKDIPSQTIVLYSGFSNIKKAKDFESNLYEKTITDLIRAAYLEIPPEGYRIKHMRLVKNFKEIELIASSSYEGFGFEVMTYLITAKSDIELDERAFLEVLDGDTVAVAILKPVLKGGESTRLFVVRRRS